MRKWLRRIGIIVLFISLALGVLYEASTHIVRGWLRGEAFYDGRPTSYWRERCDEWIKRFDSLQDAESFGEGPLDIGFKARNSDELCCFLIPGVVPASNSQKRPRPKDFLTRTADRIFARPPYEQPPSVLRGIPEADKVTQELSQELRFEKMAKNALVRAEWYREARQNLLKQGRIIHE